MVPWLVVGAVTLVVIVGAAIVVFRVVLMRADTETETETETDEDDSDVDDPADREWSSPTRPR